MKKIYLYILCIASLLLGTISCDDNTDVSTLHNMTQDELDEIARQDSIREAQKNKINADLILEYSVDVSISETLYDGAPLEIETDKIAELFGITEEQLLLGIAGEAGAPEIKGFAIDWSTRVDFASATNTNSPWGHWWDKNGDVTSWGNTDMVFAEFDTEDGIFNIGQRPGRLVAGQTVKFIEGLKYNEKRVAVVITVNAKGLAEITAPVVNTQSLSIDVIAKNDYTESPLKFDMAQVLKDLGVSSMDDVKFLGVKKGGSYAQEPATENGYWYDVEGFVGSWGDDARVYTSYGNEDFDADCIGIGQMPGKLKDGDQLTIQYGFLANEKISMLKIIVNVIPYNDPETAPEGAPTKVEKDITLTKVWSDDYVKTTADVKDILRNTFKMTTYQIHKAIMDGNLKVYLNTISEEEPTYTSDVPGYWISAEGAPVKYAEGLVFCCIGHDEENLTLYGGNHPNNVAATGTVVKTKMIVTCNGGEATFNITFNVTAKEDK